MPRGWRPASECSFFPNSALFSDVTRRSAGPLHPSHTPRCAGARARRRPRTTSPPRREAATPRRWWGGYVVVFGGTQGQTLSRGHRRAGCARAVRRQARALVPPDARRDGRSRPARVPQRGRGGHGPVRAVRAHGQRAARRRVGAGHHDVEVERAGGPIPEREARRGDASGLRGGRARPEREQRPAVRGLRRARVAERPARPGRRHRRVARGGRPGGAEPRSGHAGDVVDSRVLLFGGQASNGQLCGDLWALRDPDTDPIARDADALVDILDGRGDASSPPTGADGRRSAEADADASAARDASAEESSREPRWTRLHLRGQPPVPARAIP